jgi:alkaline phosphatase
MVRKTINFIRISFLVFFLAVVTTGFSQQAKYVFYFIGDGMGISHIGATEAYLAAETGEAGFGRLSFTQFPVNGLSTTYAHNRLITGSAAAGTALATGNKTSINTISMDVAKKNPMQTIAEKAKKEGLKVGVISSVSIDHATPAVFYAHQPERNMYYEIAAMLPASGFDFFGGGSFKDHDKKGTKPSVFGMLKDEGYSFINTKTGLEELKPGVGKVVATGTIIEPSGAIRYAIDQTDRDIPLKDFVGKAIDLLDNENGFFIMCEEGKIDWASHENDGATVIHNVIALSEAVENALEFYKAHPGETLIIVTADHETGGMSMGSVLSKYESDYGILQHQKISAFAFADMADSLMKNPENQNFDFALSLVEEYFGLGKSAGFEMTDYEKSLLRDAYNVSGGAMDMINEEKYIRYGGYHPLANAATRILNSRAGIAWGTWAHTAQPVPVFAIGEGAELFEGYYDNTDIPKKIAKAMGITFPEK